MSRFTRFGRRSFVFVAALICAFTFAAAPVVAGQVADATVFGTVTDNSGAVLPGVTVTVASPALQVKQVVEVTDARGEYRVTSLPIGTFSVEFTLPGFQTVHRDGIRLTTGFVARLDAQLAVGGVAETITVSGASPVVDVKTTAAGTQVTREILDSIPTARNGLNSVLLMAAGARPAPELGGIGDDVIFKAFGRPGNDWLTVDGLPTSTSEAAEGNRGFQTAVNYEALEETTIQTLGTNAEAPTSGMQISAITKSGGNQFHGSLFGAQQPDFLETESNLDDRLRSQGLTASTPYLARWDVAGDVGGRIIRDKLWFWVGLRNRKDTLPILGAFFADGSQSTETAKARYVNATLTGQLTSSQRLLGSFAIRDQPRDQGPATRFAAPEQARHGVFKTTPLSQATWQWVRGNRVLSVQGGQMRVVIPFPAVTTQTAQWRDDVTGFIGGPNARIGRRVDMNRYSQKATLSWYKSDMGGNHDFKIGEMYTQISRIESLQDNGEGVGNYILRYRNSTGFLPSQRGQANNVRVGNNPITPEANLGYLGLYVQDAWSVNSRLTMNMGVRYANDRGWLPPQCRVAAPREFATVFPAECWARNDLKTWNPVTPRLHAAYDITGDARTLLKGGWGRFYRMHDRLELDIANPNARKEARFAWRDLNNNQRFDAGESNLSLNGPDFAGITAPGAAYVVDGPGLDNSVPLTNLLPNPDLKEPGSDEFSASLEREIAGNFGVRFTGLYVREFNSQRIANPLRPYSSYSIPITNRDAGVDNRLGTADDPGTVLTYYEYPASLRGPAFDAAMFINDPNVDSSYKSLELALNKRLSNRWQMLMSYSATKKDVPVPAFSEYTPNAEINFADKTWEWRVNTSGSYLFPWDIQVGSNLMVQNGFNWARTVSLTGGSQIPSIVIFAEPIGSQQTDTQTLLSLNVEKKINLRAGRRLSVGLNFLNVLNANFDNEIPATRAGDGFGYTTLLIPPRLGEFTVRYTF